MSTSVSRRSSSAGHPTRQQLEELDALLKRMLDLPVNPLDETADEPSPAPAPMRNEAPAPGASPPEPMRGPHHPAFTRPAEPEAVAPPAVNYRAPETEEADLKPRVVPAAPPEPVPAPQAVEGGDWVPLESSWKPSARTWKPLSDAWQQAQSGPPPGRQEPTPSRTPELAPPRAPEPAPRADAPPAVDPVRPAMPPAPAPEPTHRQAPPTAPDVTTPWQFWSLVAFNVVFDAFLLPWGPLGRWLRGPTGRALLGILGLLFLTAAAAWAAAEWIGWTR